MTYVRIPKLGMSMTEGEIVEWHVEDGAHVTSGEPLYVLATDKVESDIESPESGIIRISGKVGQAYDVGTVVAEISSKERD